LLAYASSMPALLRPWIRAALAPVLDEGGEMKFIGFTAAIFFAGCVTQSNHGINRENETDDQRIDREVFRENWIRPSVSQEDWDFFYRPFWKSD
jgi:hypothetical protein